MRYLIILIVFVFSTACSSNSENICIEENEVNYIEGVGRVEYVGGLCALQKNLEIQEDGIVAIGRGKMIVNGVMHTYTARCTPASKREREQGKGIANCKIMNFVPLGHSI